MASSDSFGWSPGDGKEVEKEKAEGSGGSGRHSSRPPHSQCPGLSAWACHL